MSRAAETPDLALRARFLHEAETLAMDAFAAIPLYWPVGKNLVSPRVTGFFDNVEDIHRVRWMKKHE
jgi:oligopeptide transport system substrate-binding protein